MRYFSIIFLCCFSLFCFSCSKDDDNNCVKDENYFEADFDGEFLEPTWNKNLFGSSFYGLSVYRPAENLNDWLIDVLTQDEYRVIHIYLNDIQNEGSYPIESDIETSGTYFFSKTQIYITNHSMDNNSTFSISPLIAYYSLPNTGSIEITEYDSEKGVLIGTYSCKMVSTTDEEDIKEISGEFNINLKTFDKNERPCWL